MPLFIITKTDLVFVNNICRQSEKFLRIFIENQKIQPVQVNRRIIENAMCEITKKPTERNNIEKC